MKVKNNAKRLIVVNYKEGKAWKSLPIGAGQTVEKEGLTAEDIKTYTKDKTLEVLETKTTKKATADADVDQVVLPENPDAENMKALDVKELKLYCKQNKITNYSKLKEDELITLILGSLEPKE